MILRFLSPVLPPRPATVNTIQPGSNHDFGVITTKRMAIFSSRFQSNEKLEFTLQSGYSSATIYNYLKKLLARLLAETTWYRSFKRHFILVQSPKKIYRCGLWLHCTYIFAMYYQSVVHIHWSQCNKSLLTWELSLSNKPYHEFLWATLQFNWIPLNLTKGTCFRLNQQKIKYECASVTLLEVCLNSFSLKRGNVLIGRIMCSRIKTTRPMGGT